MKLKRTITVCILILGLLYGCKKHTAEIIPIVHEPIPVAVLTIASPTAGAVYATGDSIAIVATAIANAEMHGYNLEIRKLNDTALYYTEFFHNHNDTININTKWKNTLTVPANLEVVVSLLLDHDGHMHTQRVSFTTQ
jgi:hypothetical protein